MSSSIRDSKRLEHSRHSNSIMDTCDDSVIPEINLSYIASTKNTVVNTQNTENITRFTGISSQPLLMTQPTIVNGTPSTPGGQIKNNKADWLHCFSPPANPSFFIPIDNKIDSPPLDDVDPTDTFNNYQHETIPSKREQLAIYNEMYHLYLSFDHKRFPFAAVQLKVALFVLVNAINERDECILGEENENENVDNVKDHDFAEKKRQTKLFLQQVWKNARTTIISAEAHLKYHDPNCCI